MDSTSQRSEALVLYLGKGLTPYPKRDAQRLVDRYGSVKAADLVGYCETVLQALDAVKPDWTTQDLPTATEHAVQVVAAGHPELSPDALASLDWSYSWDYK